MAIDYRSFSANGDAASDSAIEKRWWTLRNKGERAQAVQGVLGLLKEYDSRRQTQYNVSSRLYGNSALFGANGMGKPAPSIASKERLTYNVVQAAVDTVTSKIAKNKPRPLFLTSGGDWRLQRRAKKLDKFVEGIFYENRAYDLGVNAFRDSCVFGDGLVQVYEKDGRVAYERVLATDLFTDWMESLNGNPRQLHREKFVDRKVLAELLPEKASVIMRGDSASAGMTGGQKNIADQVRVIESWHLPSGKDAGDGLHLITMEGEELFTEEWTRNYFPFAAMRWSKRLYGHWSQGLAEQIQNIQLEINKLLYVMQRSFELSGSFKVLVEKGSKIVKEHLNNDIGTVIEWTGMKPEYIVPPILPPEYYSWFTNLKMNAFEQAGISMLSAASKKPDGLNSGKALREFNDIESDRFMVIGQAYENFYLDLARMSIDLGREIYTREKSFKVTVPGKKFIESIDWKDIDLEDDEFYMRAFPVSSLPNDPSGRLQTIQEYMQGGLISPRTGRRLLDFPDLEQAEDLQNAPEEYLNEILEKIVEDGEYTPPEPYDNLDLAHELALEYYAQGKSSNLEAERLEMLRTFMDQVILLKQKSMPPPPPPGDGSGASASQAVPLPPPTSDMLPNVPGAAA